MEILVGLFILVVFYYCLKESEARKQRRLDELNRASSELRYLGGYPFFQGPKLLRLYDRGDRFEVEHLKIPKDKITNLQLHTVGSNSSSGNAAAGALAGAVLLGPLGALGGAALASGGGSTAVIQLTYTEGEATHDLYFDGDVMNAYPKMRLWLGTTSSQPTP